jgi:hypothetical protein
MQKEVKDKLKQNECHLFAEMDISAAIGTISGAMIHRQIVPLDQ